MAASNTRTVNTAGAAANVRGVISAVLVGVPDGTGRTYVTTVLHEGEEQVTQVLLVCARVPQE